MRFGTNIAHSYENPLKNYVLLDEALKKYSLEDLAMEEKEVEKFRNIFQKLEKGNLTKEEQKKLAEEIANFGLYVIKIKVGRAFEDATGQDAGYIICGYGEMGDRGYPLGAYLKICYNYYTENPGMLDSSQHKMPKEISKGIDEVVRMQGVEDRVEGGETIKIDEYMNATENLSKLAGCKFIYNENGNFEVEGITIEKDREH